LHFSWAGAHGTDRRENAPPSHICEGGA